MSFFKYYFQTISLISVLMLLYIIFFQPIFFKSILQNIDPADYDENSRVPNDDFENPPFVLKNPKTGVLYYGESNGTRLVAIDPKGVVLWRFNAPPGAAFVSSNTSLSDDGAVISAHGRCFSDVDTANGNELHGGCDGM